MKLQHRPEHRLGVVQPAGLEQARPFGHSGLGAFLGVGKLLGSGKLEQVPDLYVVGGQCVGVLQFGDRVGVVAPVIMCNCPQNVGSRL